MKKSQNKDNCRGLIVLIMFIAIFVGLILFLNMLSINRFYLERLVLYSVLVIFGISLSAETCLYRRLREEEAKLKKEIEQLKKELEEIKK